MNQVRGMDSLSGGHQQHGGVAISIVSGKGGVGKTNLALNLGIQIARRRRRVILLDADFGLANADILLNVTPLADFGDLLDPARRIDDLLVAAPGGLRVLCGISGLTQRSARSDVTPDVCARGLARLRSECDVLLIDCGAGLSPATVALALASERLIVATTPEPTALADSYATLKLLMNRGLVARTGVIVNMARSRQEGQAVAARLAAVTGRFLGLCVEDLGHVPLDRHVPLAVRARVPLAVRFPRCSASSCIQRISGRLVPPPRSAVRGPGVWSRVAGLFL